MQTPIALSIAEACQASNIGRTTLYQAISNGELRAVKRGRRTLILSGDLHGWIHNLPAIRAKSSNSTAITAAKSSRQQITTAESGAAKSSR